MLELSERANRVVRLAQVGRSKRELQIQNVSVSHAVKVHPQLDCRDESIILQGEGARSVRIGRTRGEQLVDSGLHTGKLVMTSYISQEEFHSTSSY